MIKSTYDSLRHLTSFSEVIGNASCICVDAVLKTSHKVYKIKKIQNLPEEIVIKKLERE